MIRNTKKEDKYDPDIMIYGWLVVLLVSNMFLIYFLGYKHVTSKPMLDNTNFVYTIFGLLPNILLSAYSIQYISEAIAKKTDKIDTFQKIEILLNLVVFIMLIVAFFNN